MITSILDTDFYICTQCDAALQLCPDAEAEYAFVDRNKLVYDADFLRLLTDAIADMSSLQLRIEERKFLEKKAPYLSRGFLEYLQNYRFDPSEVVPTLTDDGNLKIAIKGPLIRTIWWEVPLMATISELFFSKWKDNIKQWTYDGQSDFAESKARQLSNAGCKWADFGTRRRRTYQTQYMVVESMRNFHGFVGTSNPHLAMMFDTKAIGTQAHQFIQIWSALSGLRHANRFAMDAWVKVFRGSLGTVLTDTFGTDAFLNDFDLYHAKLWDGVRHDSSSPFVFADKIVAHYQKLGIAPNTKTIVFSDSLNVDRAIEIKHYCDGLGINCSFGIGTSITNHFEGPLKPLNIVIKLVRLNGISVVKLSDTPEKAICEDSQEGRDALRIAKYTFFNQSL